MSVPDYSLLVDLRWCLDELLADRVIDQRGYNLVMTSRRDKSQHPLITISEFGLVNGHDKEGDTSVANCDSPEISHKKGFLIFLCLI